MLWKTHQPDARPVNLNVVDVDFDFLGYPIRLSWREDDFATIVAFFESFPNLWYIILRSSQRYDRTMPLFFVAVSSNRVARSLSREKKGQEIQ